MQSAQINSPRFAYQTAAPESQTLDDLRVVRGNYAGSFSGKSKQPLWIAAAMIAAVGGAVLGVNLYAGHDAMIVGAPLVAPAERVAPPTAAKSSITSPTSPVAESVNNNPVVDAPRPAFKSGDEVSVASPPVRAANAIAATGNGVAKSTVVTPKKAAPVLPAPATVTTPPQQEVAPPVQEPLPAPSPIMEEKTIVPAPIPTPAPELPPVEAPKV